MRTRHAFGHDFDNFGCGFANGLLDALLKASGEEWQPLPELVIAMRTCALADVDQFDACRLVCAVAA